MHILFDARAAASVPMRMRIYAHALLELFPALLAPEDHVTVLVVAGQLSPMGEAFAGITDKVAYVSTRYAPRTMRGFYELQRVATEVKPDVYWSVDPLTPAMHLRVPHLFALTDLTIAITPEDFSRKDRFLWWFYGCNQLRQARRVVCPSHVMQAQCERILGAKVRNKISVVYQGVHQLYQRRGAQEVKNLRAHYRLPEKFLLFVGEDAPHKNLDTVLLALAGNDEISPMPLVVAGYGSDTPARRARVHELGLDRLVRFIGQVSREELPVLYSAAWLLLHPSTMESFSQTIVQGMACGVPVLCAASPENEELFGSAVMRIHPSDLLEWRRSLLTLMVSTVLRDRLITAGPELAAKYSWHETARRTLEICNEIGRHS